MKNVLCFGDSNTFGTPPLASLDEARRYDGKTRWPGAMRKILGHAWHVIEEGLPGRTTIRDDLIEGIHKNGRRYLAACLESHRPLDVIVLMLGTQLWRQARRRTRLDLRHLGAGLLLGTLNFGNIVFYVRAHQQLHDSPAVVFATMNIGVVLLGTAVGMLASGERTSWLTRAAIVLAVAAIAVIATAP